MNTITRQMRKLQQALKRVNLHSPRVLGATFCVSVSLLLVVLVYTTTPMVPRINDITTDLDDPVQFTQNTKLNPFPDAFKEQIKGYAGYADLKPLTVRLS